MFKSIFNKLLITYLIIIIIIISSLSFILSTIYNIHIFNEKKKSLKNVAIKAQEIVEQFNNGDVSKKELEAYLNSMGYVTDSSIYMLNLNKNALKNPTLLEKENDFLEGYLINDLNKILDGERVFRKKQYSQAMDTYVVFWGSPLKMDSEIKGAILIFSPVSHITRDIRDINLIIWGIALIAIILSAIFIYMNSIRISRPIKNIDRAAKMIASGEDAEDIHVDSKDEIGQLASTFNYMKNRLIEIENMRREFIANVSHDLKTPLTSINGFIEAMIDGVIEMEEYDETLNIIKEETSRLIKLTNDILQLSKIQSGVIKLSKEYINVKQLFENIVSTTVFNSKDKIVDYSIDCHNELQVLADRDRLKQIIINLINNSIKYSNNEVFIQIRAKSLGENIEFRIKDNGIGIEQDKIDFVFEKFYRTDKSRSSKRKGTGLGLSIVKNLVKLHGGYIYANSELDKGTEIVFTIPNK